MDPLLMKYAAGGALILLTAFLGWFDKIDKGVLSLLLTGAALALGFQITPA